MKPLILLTLMNLQVLAQESPREITLPENSPLALALARTAGLEELKTGTLYTIKITPPATKPSPGADVPAQTTPLNKDTLSLLNYRGKKGAPSSIAQAATRSGDAPDIRIVVLSPSEGALTHLAQPRLWWHQSSASEGGELEFILTKRSPQGDTEVFRRLIPPMPEGFNVIDLSHPAVNPQRILLESGNSYQWTINHRDKGNASPAYSSLRFEENKQTAKSFSQKTTAAGMVDSSLLTHLSQSKNWHETLDLIATQSRLAPKNQLFRDAQNRLLKEAEIFKIIENQE